MVHQGIKIEENSSHLAELDVLFSVRYHGAKSMMGFYHNSLRFSRIASRNRHITSM